MEKIHLSVCRNLWERSSRLSEEVMCECFRSLGVGALVGGKGKWPITPEGNRSRMRESAERKWRTAPEHPAWQARAGVHRCRREGHDLPGTHNLALGPRLHEPCAEPVPS